MANQTSLSVISATSDGDVTKSITDVNPNAEIAACHEFGRQLTALSTHEFKGVNRIEKTELDAPNKPSPSIALGQASIAAADILAARDTPARGVYVDFTYVGDGELVIYNPGFDENLLGLFVPEIRNGKLFITAAYGLDSSNEKYSKAKKEFKFLALEGKTYKRVLLSQKITITL